MADGGAEKESVGRLSGGERVDERAVEPLFDVGGRYLGDHLGGRSDCVDGGNLVVFPLRQTVETGCPLQPLVQYHQFSHWTALLSGHLSD